MPVETQKIKKSIGGDWRVYTCDPAGTALRDGDYSVIQTANKTFAVFNDEGDQIGTDLTHAQAEALMNA